MSTPTDDSTNYDTQRDESALSHSQSGSAPVPALSDSEADGSSPSPAPPPAGWVQARDIVTINAIGEGLTVAGGSVIAPSSHGERRWFGRLTSRQRVLGAIGGFVVSVAAGFVVWFLTDDRDPTVDGRDAPTTNTELDASGYATGEVNGCNTFGENCDGNPIYIEVPPPSGYDWAAFPKIATVPNGTTLTARCWAIGAVTTNYPSESNPPDHGPDPYGSDTYYNVQAPDGRWGWIPDTYFVRDQSERLGLPRCPATA